MSIKLPELVIFGLLAGGIGYAVAAITGNQLGQLVAGAYLLVLIGIVVYVTKDDEDDDVQTFDDQPDPGETRPDDIEWAGPTDYPIEDE